MSDLEREPEPAARARDRRRGSHQRPWLVLLLSIALVTALLGYASERDRAGELEARVRALDVELATARERLEAHERRLAVIRSHVTDLSDRIGLLQQTVSDSGGQGE